MSDLSRRDLLKVAVTASALVSTGCAKASSPPAETNQAGNKTEKPMAAASPPIQTILGLEALPKAGVWPTDPFFCVHHNDEYPAGNAVAGLLLLWKAGRLKRLRKRRLVHVSRTTSRRLPRHLTEG